MSVIELAFITAPAVAVTTAVWIADRLSHSTGRHAITPQRSHAAPRDPFANPADRTDPHGEQYVTDLHDDRDDPFASWRPDPRPLAALVRGLDGTGGTGWLPALPDDPPPDATGHLPPAEAYLGMPSAEYVDQLFAKYEQARK